MDPQESIRFWYRGRVQGVWFRKTSAEIAKQVGVNGFVKNLPDGSVEAVAIGTSDAVQAFAEAVAAHYRNHIDECTRVPWRSSETFTQFEIRY